MNFEGIDKTSPVPYYYQLEQLLRERIENGRLKPGDILPSETELCSTFRVSRTVVRQALNKLCQDGIVYKEKGRGTFVAKPKLPLNLFPLKRSKKSTHPQGKLYILVQYCPW